MSSQTWAAQIGTLLTLDMSSLGIVEVEVDLFLTIIVITREQWRHIEYVELSGNTVDPGPPLYPGVIAVHTYVTLYTDTHLALSKPHRCTQCRNLSLISHVDTAN